MPIERINVDPAVVKWAVAYSRREPELRQKFGDNLAGWEAGKKQPTTNQLEQFAKAARIAPFYLYTSTIPDLSLDVPQMRTIGDEPVDDPSPGLTQTVYTCQSRQDWFLDFAELNDLEEVEFVGSLSLSDDPVDAAQTIRKQLGWDKIDRRDLTADNYRKRLADRAEDAGIMVMITGIVDNNTHWKLDPEEFRGFSLVDKRAPLVFVNSRDSLSAQAFTLAHEIAHIFLGESAVSAPDDWRAPQHPVERWCNAVAAEILVPTDELVEQIGAREPLATLGNLGRHFKVSRLVLLRRLHENNLIDQETFRNEYRRELLASRARRSKRDAGENSQGGDYYANVLRSVGRRFATEVCIDAKYQGTLLYDACRLLGLSNVKQLRKLGEALDVSI